jgi:uncharacterized protein (TIGR02996 family)
MSAMLRYHVGRNFGHEFRIQFECVWEKLQPLEIGNSTWAIILELPDQLDLAERTLACLDRMQATGSALQSMVVFRNKLWMALGLPGWCRFELEEVAMVDGLRGDLNAWLVYADWLDDGKAGDYGEARARVIRAWADPDVACEVKYGVPTLAREADKVR